MWKAASCTSLRAKFYPTHAPLFPRMAHTLPVCFKPSYDKCVHDDCTHTRSPNITPGAIRSTFTCISLCSPPTPKSDCSSEYSAARHEPYHTINQIHKRGQSHPTIKRSPPPPAYGTNHGMIFLLGGHLFLPDTFQSVRQRIRRKWEEIREKFNSPSRLQQRRNAPRSRLVIPVCCARQWTRFKAG